MTMAQIILFGMLSLSSIAAATESSTAICEELLQSYSSSLKGIEHPTPDSAGPLIARPSVSFTHETRKGLWGSIQKKLVRERATWNSRYEVVIGYPQGDLLQFIRLVGPEAALFFGVHLASSDELWVPSVGEINTAIERFNDGLEPSLQIPIRYQVVALPLGMQHNWTDDFLNHFQFPWHSDGLMLAQGVGHRLSALLLPETVIQRMAQRLLFLRQVQEQISLMQVYGGMLTQVLYAAASRHIQGMMNSILIDPNAIFETMRRAEELRDQPFGVRDNIWEPLNEEYLRSLIREAVPGSRFMREIIVREFTRNGKQSLRILEQHSPLGFPQLRDQTTERIEFVRARAESLLRMHPSPVIEQLLDFQGRPHAP